MSDDIIAWHLACTVLIQLPTGGVTETVQRLGSKLSFFHTSKADEGEVMTVSRFQS